MYGGWVDGFDAKNWKNERTVSLYSFPGQLFSTEASLKRCKAFSHADPLAQLPKVIL